MSVQVNPSFEAVMDSPQSKPLKILIVGAGPVSIRFCYEILKRKNDSQSEIDIHVFSNEPYHPYNKKQLSNWLSGSIKRENVDLDIEPLLKLDNFKLSHVKIENIDKRNKTIIDRLGVTHHYDYLILATGTRARVPNIRGINQKGVYTFKNLKDAENLFARLTRSRNTVIVGGGIVGVQTAISLKKYNTKVHLIEQSPNLMPSIFDEASSNLIKQELTNLGIEVHTSSGVREVLGESELESVRLYGNKTIDCDTAILCVGNRSNIELARRENLAISEGIIVNDQLFASNQSIMAIGGCSEHRGKTYGSLEAGLEQATIAASALTDKQFSYKGSIVINQIEVAEKSIISFGEVDNLQKQPGLKIYVFENIKQGIYRKLILLKNKIIGFISIGMNDGLQQFIEQYQNNQSLYFYQRFRFKRTGCI